MESLPLDTSLLQEAIVHTLIDSLWQGSIVVIALWLVKQIFKPLPQIQYFLSLTGLLSIVLMCFGNFINYSVAPQQLTLPFGGNMILKLDQSLVFWLFSSWVLGAFIFFIRFVLSHLFLKKIIRNAQYIQQHEWLDNFSRIKVHFNIGKNVLLMHSDRISSAFLTGVLKPIVIIPTAWVNRLEPKEIECILAHEFSHIRSKDHWINLFVQVSEMIFYFNPAVHILINHIKLDRELQADLSANKYVQSPLVYAKLILKVEEQTGMIPLFTIPFFKQRNQLRRRIESVLNIKTQNQYKENALSLYVALSCLLFCGLQQSKVSSNPTNQGFVQLYSISYQIDDPQNSKSGINNATSYVKNSRPLLKESRIALKSVNTSLSKKQSLKLTKERLTNLEEISINDVNQEIVTIAITKEAPKEIVVYTQSEIKLDSLSTIEGDGAWIISKQGKSFQPKTPKAVILLRTETSRVSTSEVNSPDSASSNERGNQTN
ncbi:MAG: M56 family metallopeptidase [Saprospiraceae bacterium]|nr:M56 family metallopeptidase [Saprospiraceae bacterium]